MPISSVWLLSLFQI